MNVDMNTESLDVIKNYSDAKDAYIDRVKSYIESLLKINFCDHARVEIKPNYVTKDIINAYIYIEFIDDNNQKIFGNDIVIRYAEKYPINFNNLEMTLEMDYYSKTIQSDDNLGIERCRAISALATCLSVIKHMLDTEPKEDYIKASIAIGEYYRENREKEMRMLRLNNDKRNSN